jgi:hypothetical protein
VRRKTIIQDFFFSIETIIQLYNTMNNSFEVIEKAMIFKKKIMRRENKEMINQ